MHNAAQNFNQALRDIVNHILPKPYAVPNITTTPMQRLRVHEQTDMSLSVLGFVFGLLPADSQCSPLGLYLF